MLGIGLLVYDARSLPSWLLAIGCIASTFARVLVNLQVTIPAISLASTVLMFVLFAAGLGLVARGGGRPRR